MKLIFFVEGIGSTNSFNDSYEKDLSSSNYKYTSQSNFLNRSGFSESFTFYEYSNVSSYESVFGEAVGIDDSKIYLGKGKDDFNLEVLGGSNSSGLVSSTLNAGRGRDEINISVEAAGAINSGYYSGKSSEEGEGAYASEYSSNYYYWYNRGYSGNWSYDNENSYENSWDYSAYGAAIEYRTLLLN